MNIFVKILLSVVILFVGVMCMGLWPYIPGPSGVLVSIALFIGCVVAVISIWKKRPKDGEGDVFKNR